MIIKKFVYHNIDLYKNVKDIHKNEGVVVTKLEKEENQNSSVIGNNIDLESIKQGCYNNGYNDGYQEGINFQKKSSEKEFEVLSKKKVDTQNFIKLLENNIEKLNYNNNKDREEIQEYLLNVTNILVKKLCLTVPVNLQELLNSYLLSTIKNAYNGSIITINVNKVMFNLCKDILDKSNLPLEIKNKIKIEAKDNIKPNDCNITMNSTIMVYNQELLVNQINQLLLNN